MSEVVVIIPAFNRTIQLVCSVRSVLSQSFQSFELIVVDDNSTGDLSEAKDLVESTGHKWIALQKNTGPAGARNAGVRESKAEWISFLDSDDEWGAEKLAVQMEWHRQHPEVRISQVKEDWYRNGVGFSKPKHLRQSGGNLFEASCRRCAIGPSCVMMHRDLWDESGGFDERFRVCEDFALWLRVCSQNVVGLVPGDVLVKKNGGHSDQLSVETPLLERYRFLALLEWIHSNQGEDEKMAMAKDSLHYFGDQLSGFGEKQGLSEWASLFQGFDYSRAPDGRFIEKAWLTLHTNWKGSLEK